MSPLPFIAIGDDQLGDLAEVVECARCGAAHPIEYGTSRTLLPDNTWSEPVPSKTLGFYQCEGNLYVGTVKGKTFGARGENHERS